ncbi:prephenate dehydrogenase [Paracoccus zhejiangensis]|uniref:Prephenate dehydrogenase/arogenate dehydrogenase family protein n=1 Tax=Paracoccus zhejiangensis TaxID=1077935 RepID=A0A2H5EZE0_9RHOB|nr:prephenate dehydrogenase [Paracoccus zhejiangensis]AUH64668.1 prephenate dehydrogenase/arogenate dehydrogenase family protein [Paracoccus zhejiangensis]
MKTPKPRLAIIGFGAFGQLAARHLRDHARICVSDPVSRADDLPQVGLAEAARADVILLAVPLSCLEQVLTEIAPHLRPGAVVIDVTSVKLRPAELMQALLPDHVGIIATHPLFGPESARDGIAGHRLAWCPLRGGEHRRLAAFLRWLGLKVLTTTPDQHDAEMAMVQGLTHLISRSLGALGPMPTRLATASFQHLIEAARMVQADSPELLRTILCENPHAEPVRRRFLDAAAAVTG